MGYITLVEGLTHKKIAPILLMHIMRFILNIIVLSLMIPFIWVPYFEIIGRQILLTILAVQLILAGICFLICDTGNYFVNYFCFLEKFEYPNLNIQIWTCLDLAYVHMPITYINEWSIWLGRKIFGLSWIWLLPKINPYWDADIINGSCSNFLQLLQIQLFF